MLGPVGSGKTFFMTLMSALSENVYSNYKITIPDIKIKKFSMDLINNDLITNSDVFLDEIYMYAESRKFGSDINLLLSYFAFQSRKLNLTIWCSSQLLRTFDIRLREMIDLAIICKFRKNKKKDNFRYRIYNNQTQEFTKRIKIKYENAKQYFKYYKTNELIITDAFLELRKNVSSNELSKDEIIIIAKKMIQFAEINNQKITREFTKIFCKKEDLSIQSKFINNLYLETKLLMIQIES